MKPSVELKKRYAGDAESRPKANEYMYYVVVPLIPVIESWELDEWGDVVIELRDKIELSAKQFVEILEGLIRGGIVVRNLTGTDKIKLTEY